MSRQTRQSALAERIGSEVSRAVLESLPRIAEAMDRDDASQASFSATAAFALNREGDLLCTLSFRERIPLEPVEIKVGIRSGQLGLFDGPARAEPDPDPEE